MRKMFYNCVSDGRDKSKPPASLEITDYWGNHNKSPAPAQRGKVFMWRESELLKVVLKQYLSLMILPRLLKKAACGC